MGSDPRELVREFFAAWTDHDPERVASFFTEDGVYHNVPMEQVQGREAVRDLVASWLEQMGEIALAVVRGTALQRGPDAPP